MGSGFLPTAQALPPHVTLNRWQRRRDRRLGRLRPDGATGVFCTVEAAARNEPCSFPGRSFPGSPWVLSYRTTWTWPTGRHGEVPLGLIVGLRVMNMAPVGGSSGKGKRLNKGEALDLPARKGWRRGLVFVRDWGAGAVGFVVAALIVFGHLADPGDAWVWHLVVVTAVGPLLLSAFGKGFSWLLRWWWRRRRSYQARHLRSDEDSMSRSPEICGISSSWPL